MKISKYSKSLTVALRPDAYDLIKKITDDGKISMAEWVRDAVDAALNTLQQREENMK